MGAASPLIGFLRRWFGCCAVSGRAASGRAVSGRAALGRGTTGRDARVEAHADLVATASHEIRTPLAGILGMAELLAQTPLAPDQRSYVDAILGSGRALADLVDGLLDVARVEAGRLDTVERPYDLRALAQSVVELLAPRAQTKGLEISCSIGSEIPWRIVGDPARLRQVLLNLAGNAVKFTERGGVGIGTCVSAGRLLISVVDTGPGVPEDRRSAIFQPFERGVVLATAPPGTGLGLSIARRLSEAMGGKLFLESSGTSGSRFTLNLPLRPAPDAAGPEAAPGGGLEGLSVIFVSSLPFEAGALAARVAEAGARAAVATDADLCYAALSGGPPPDVLVVDAALGDGTASTLVAAARAAGVPRCLVLVAPFARRTPSDLVSVFDGWLVKPVRIASLFARIGDNPSRTDADLTPPQAAGADPRMWASPSPPAPGPLAGLHILVAEDDPVNGRLAEARLERLGARVTRVTDGHAAVSAVTAALEPGGTTFDAALLDLHMPGLDGFETARRIRDLERTSGTAPMRIVALTASAQPGDRDAARAAGFDLVLMKPVEPGPLAAALKCGSVAARENAVPSPLVSAEARGDSAPRAEDRTRSALGSLR